MEALPRPRQVTLAGWLIILGSAAMVLTVYDQIASLHTLDTREATAEMLAAPPFDVLGLSVGEALGLVRVLATIAGVCAAATAVLGWHVLQRSKSSRVVLSVLAVPLFVTGLVSGGVLSSAVAAAVALLWLQPARDWFDGRWNPAPEGQGRESWPRNPFAVPPTGQAGQAGQAPEQPAAPSAEAPVGQPASQPPAWQQPFGQPGSTPYLPPASYPLVAPARRPGAVLAAAVLTWVFSGLVAVLFVIGSIVTGTDPEIIRTELDKNPTFAEQGVTVEMVQVMFVVMAVAVTGWALSACVVAFFVLRGKPWARVLLAVSTAGAGLLMLLCVLVNPVMLIPAAACGATLAMLLRRDVAAWFSAPITTPTRRQ
ncbi:hypothetical protein [Nocardioides sp.]|uniref:hypothetical protein n=1 Tax=Nocardioides sp. TaxID=35761 RepID=UPI0039E256EB